MPARTNAFQELVSLIQKTLSPIGATVSDSSLVQVSGLQTQREVDILIDSPLGPYRIKVAVEVSDDSRRFGIEDFDSYVAKYRGECRLLVDKLVLVSRRGFTQGVVEKAARLDIELLTLQQAMEKNWTTVNPPTLTLNWEPHVCKIEFEPAIGDSEPQELMQCARMICPDGHDHGTPRERANTLLRVLLNKRPDAFTEILTKVRQSPSGLGHIHAGYETRGWKVQFGDSEFSIDRMTVWIHVAAGTAPIKCTDYEISSSKGPSRRVQHLQSTIGGRTFSWIMTGDPQQPKIAMRIDPATKTTTQQADRAARGMKRRNQKIERRRKKDGRRRRRR